MHDLGATGGGLNHPNPTITASPPPLTQYIALLFSFIMITGLRIAISCSMDGHK